MSDATAAFRPAAGDTGVSVAPEPRVARPRLGFAGVGWIGRNRLDAIAGSGFGEVTAVADPDLGALAKVADAHPAATRVGSFEELLAIDLDGVVVATPSALHAGQSIAALERGLAVFCQKPLARTGPETTAVITAARKANRLLGVDLSYRFTAGMVAIQDLIRRGDLGTIHAVEAVFHNAYGPDKAWFYDPKASGGGCLLDLGIHLVDLALWTLGFPKVESAHAALRRRGVAHAGAGEGGVEDYATGVLELAGGATVQLACSWHLPAGCDARIEVNFYGSRGGASFRNVGGSFYDFVAEQFLPDRSRRTLATPPDAWGGRAAVAWAQCLSRSNTFDPSIEHLAIVAETLDRLYGR